MKIKLSVNCGCERSSFASFIGFILLSERNITAPSLSVIVIAVTSGSSSIVLVMGLIIARLLVTTPWLLALARWRARDSPRSLSESDKSEVRWLIKNIDRTTAINVSGNIDKNTKRRCKSQFTMVNKFE